MKKKGNQISNISGDLRIIVLLMFEILICMYINNRQVASMNKLSNNNQTQQRRLYSPECQAAESQQRLPQTGNNLRAVHQSAAPNPFQTCAGVCMDIDDSGPLDLSEKNKGSKEVTDPPLVPQAPSLDSPAIDVAPPTVPDTAENPIKEKMLTEASFGEPLRWLFPSETFPCRFQGRHHAPPEPQVEHSHVKREPYILLDDFDVFNAESMFENQHGGSTFDVDYFLPGPDENMFG